MHQAQHEPHPRLLSLLKGSTRSKRRLRGDSDAQFHTTSRSRDWLVILAIGVLAIVGLLRITSAQDSVSTTTTGGTPTAVSLAPAESWNCILDQRTLTASLTNAGGAVGNDRIEFTLNRFPQAVGDIVEVGGSGQSKRTNTFAVVQTSSGGGGGSHGDARRNPPR